MDGEVNKTYVEKLCHSHYPLAVRVYVCAAIMQHYAKGSLQHSHIYVRLTAALARMNAAISGLPLPWTCGTEKRLIYSFKSDFGN